MRTAESAQVYAPATTSYERSSCGEQANLFDRVVGTCGPRRYAPVFPDFRGRTSADSAGFADEAGYAFVQLISEGVGNAVGRPVVIERRPGATGRIAAEALKNAPADGMTLYLAPIVVPVLAPLVFHDL